MSREVAQRRTCYQVAPMGFCPRLCRLPMLHITILSNGYLDGGFLERRRDLARLGNDRSADAALHVLTARLMVSMVMPLMVRIWVFATRVSRPNALTAATAEVRRTPEVKRRAARSRVDRVEVENSNPRRPAPACVGGRC